MGGLREEIRKINLEVVSVSFRKGVQNLTWPTLKYEKWDRLRFDVMSGRWFVYDVDVKSIYVDDVLFKPKSKLLLRMSKFIF